MTRPITCRNERFGYRTGRSMLIPYYRIPLAGPGIEFAVERLVVGPVPNGDQALRAVKGPYGEASPKSRPRF